MRGSRFELVQDIEVPTKTPLKRGRGLPEPLQRVEPTVRSVDLRRREHFEGVSGIMYFIVMKFLKFK